MCQNCWHSLRYKDRMLKLALFPVFVLRIALAERFNIQARPKERPKEGGADQLVTPISVPTRDCRKFLTGCGQKITLPGIRKRASFHKIDHGFAFLGSYGEAHRAFAGRRNRSRPVSPPPKPPQMARPPVNSGRN